MCVGHASHRRGLRRPQRLCAADGPCRETAGQGLGRWVFCSLQQLHKQSYAAAADYGGCGQDEICPQTKQYRPVDTELAAHTPEWRRFAVSDADSVRFPQPARHFFVFASKQTVTEVDTPTTAEDVMRRR